jgi:hypothetical protein
MNFSAFDNFGRTAPYTFNNSLDGQVDMILFIWSNVDHDINYSAKIIVNGTLTANGGS